RRAGQVRATRQERPERGLGEDVPRILGRFLEAADLILDAAVARVYAVPLELGADARELLVEHAADELAVDARAAVQRGAVPQPLPRLRARDLERGEVLHQVVPRDAADVLV